MSEEKPNEEKPKSGFELSDEEKPSFEKVPEMKCKECEVAALLGLLTGSCNLLDEKGKKEECWEKVKPYGEHPEEVDSKKILKEHLVEYGAENLNSLVDRLNWLIMEASQEARDELISKGVLNPDGSYKEEKK